MQVIVLGAAAGGGYPQWNDGSPVARRAWAGDPAAPRRTQSSVAIAADAAGEKRWVLFNCSPDIRQQILATPALHPGAALRHSPIADIVLTNGDVDHVGGLLTLRERTPFGLWASAAVHGILRDNPIFGVLAEGVVARQVMTLGETRRIAGLDIALFPVPGKVPLYMEGAEVAIGGEGEATVGVAVRDPATGGLLHYVPGCAAMPDHLKRRLAGGDALLFDGTLWTDDEMIALGVGQKTGQRMGHLPISGPGGTLALLDGLPVARRVFVHINTTNPVLLADSPERHEVEAAGWQVAEDGMELRL
ncbi:MAG: pyrroloquinoline quinone biosynthesis protein PqqB [Sneathiellaceae bacterium]